MEGIRTPRRPFCCVDDSEAERCQGIDRDEVGAEEDVRMSEAPHHHVVSSPRPNALECEELIPGHVRVGARIEHNAALGNGCCETAHRVPASGRHGEQFIRRFGKTLDGREGMGQSVADPQCWVERVTQSHSQASGHGTCPRKRYLLADHRTKRCLYRIRARRGTPPRDSGNEWSKALISGKGCIDRLRIGIEVEQSANPLDSCGEIGPLGKTHPSFDVIVPCPQPDNALAVRQRQHLSERRSVPGFDTGNGMCPEEGK